ncbi:MAG: hypothetical protein JXA09_14890 [Anaerolineae bacterium]|nr:hypothetical protein [Anaerolineae bacterium]
MRRLREWLFWARVRRAARPSLYVFPWVAVLLLLSGTLAVSSEYSALQKWESSASPGLALAEFVAGVPGRRRAYVEDMAERGVINSYERTAELQRVAALETACQDAAALLRAKADAAGWDVVARHGIDTLAQSMVSLIGGKVVEGATKTQVGGRFLRWIGAPASATEWVDDVVTTFANALITAEGGPVSRASVPDWDREWARLDAQIVEILGQDHDALLRARLSATIRGLRVSCRDDPDGYAAYLRTQAEHYDRFYGLSNAAMRARDPSVDPARQTSPWESSEDVRAWLNEQAGCTLPPAPTPTTPSVPIATSPAAQPDVVTLTGQVVKAPGSPNEVSITIPWGPGNVPSGYARFRPREGSISYWNTCATVVCQVTDGWCQRPSTDTLYPEACGLTVTCAGQSCTQESYSTPEVFDLDLECKADGSCEGRIGLYWITVK